MHSDTSDTNAGLRAQTTELPAHRSAITSVDEEHGETEEHVHLPPQSIWPITTAFGVAVAGAGTVLGWRGPDNVIVIVGLLIMIYGVASWVQELRHEPH